MYFFIISLLQNALPSDDDDRDPDDPHKALDIDLDKWVRLLKMHILQWITLLVYTHITYTVYLTD